MSEVTKAYLLVHLRILNREQFLEYAKVARSIAPKFGARYLSTGRPVEVLEGTGSLDPIVLTEWPSAEHIRRFWNSAEYQDAVKLRIGAAEVTATVFAACPDVPGTATSEKAQR